MENMWDGFFDNIDWDSVDKEVAAEREKTALLSYVNDVRFDYKRGYIRKFMRAHPEITDRDVIGLATEQMQEAHEGGVELDPDDALRFVANKKPMTVQEAVKLLTEAGIDDENIMDVIFAEDNEEGYGTEPNLSARKKAGLLTRYADLLARNKDILLLGIPVFDQQSDWAQAKLGFFREDLNDAEKMALKQMKDIADRSNLRMEHGTAFLTFQIYNIWNDFE